MKKSECTIRFVASNSAKSAVKFLNSEKLRTWSSRNLLDPPRFLKDYAPWVDQKSATPKANLSSPLRSLQKTMKNDYKLDYILTWRKITSSGKFEGSWFHSLFFLKSWFHVNSGKDQKMQTSDEEANNTIVFVVMRGVKTI